MLAGCATAWRGATTITTPSGQQLCALHRTPLATERAYAPEPGYCSGLLSEDYVRIIERFPNPWPSDAKRRYSSGWSSHPITVRYCERCEAAVREAVFFM